MSDTPHIVQFGTSRFLQAHADLFFSETGVPVTVVQSSGDPARAARLGALAQGYPVRIRGIQDGVTIDTETRVTSVTRTLSTATDWNELSRIVTDQATAILSNTGDRGYDALPADHDPQPRQDMSYPAKLFHLLAARWRADRAPLTIYPTELVPENGRVLRARVLEIAAANGAELALHDWLSDCIWVNSLVDRIVSEPIEPAGAVAEPYALWAIEAGPGVTVPCLHSAVQLVEDLEETERLKLHILNLGHTVMARIWQREGAAPNQLVRQMMEGDAWVELEAIYRSEVLPGFAAKGMGPQAQAYLATTLERFRNPFLDHRVADLAQNHRQKVQRRIAAFVAWVGPDGPAMPELQAIVEKAEQ